MVTVELISAGSMEFPLSYVIIAARHKGGWLFVKHRRRGGYEMPAGHPEEGEGSTEAAVRELTEETGALDFTLSPITFYSVHSGQGRKYGRLFYAEVDLLGKLTDIEEIESVRVFRRLPRNLSLPEVMSFLFRIARRHAEGLKD